jgi:hypothetical protein
MAGQAPSVTQLEYRVKLRRVAKDLVGSGLAISTRKRYGVGMRGLHRFAVAIGWRPQLPVSEAVLCLFVASRAGEIKATTMKGYLCAIYSWHVDEGVPVDFTPFRTLKRALRGMELLDKGVPTKRAHPVTMAAVALMGSATNVNNIDEVVFMAIASLATAGLFRLGELVPSNWRDPPVLAASRVRVLEEGVEVHLPRSKTDPTGAMGPMFISKNKGLACPWLWLRRMRQMVPVRQGQPAFKNAEGKAISREWVIHRLNTMMTRVGLGGLRYSGHSFRRGGATSLAAAGVQDHIIAKLGRWKSATYQLYVAASPSRLAAAQKEMAQSTCVFGVVGPAEWSLLVINITISLPNPHHASE